MKFNVKMLANGKLGLKCKWNRKGLLKLTKKDKGKSTNKLKGILLDTRKV